MKYYRLRDFQAWKVCVIFSLAGLIIMLFLLIASFFTGQFADPTAAAEVIGTAIMTYITTLISTILTVYTVKLFLGIFGGVRMTLDDID